MGENLWEEIDVVVRQSNGGWPQMEGPSCFQQPRGCSILGTPPIFAFNHLMSPLIQDDVSIIGGFVYNGTSKPGLRGFYIFGEHRTGIIWALNFSPSGSPLPFASFVGNLGSTLSSFGVDVRGELFALDYFNGFIYGFM